MIDYEALKALNKLDTEIIKAQTNRYTDEGDRLWYKLVKEENKLLKTLNAETLAEWENK